MKDKLLYSLAGHDKGKLYYVLKEDQDNVWVCDGNIRTLDRPKKKNKKHVQVINQDLSKPPYDVTDNLLSNEKIKRAIKLYRKDI